MSLLLTQRPPAPVGAVTAARRPPSRRSLWWLAWATAPLMLASDFKVRLRSDTESISGHPDIYVLGEIVVYIIVATVLLWKFPWRPGVRRVSALAFAGWAFAGFYAFTAIYSPYRQLAIVRAFQLLLIASIGQIAANHADRRHLHRAMHAFIGLTAFGCLLGFGVRQTHVAPTRFSWLAVHPIVSAMYMGAALTLAVAYMSLPRLREHGPHWPTWLYGVLAVMFAYCMVRNHTRGAWVGLLFAIALVLAGAVGPRRKLEIVLGFVVVVAAVMIGAGATIVSYTERGQTASKLASLNYRTTLWSDAFHAWKGQPLFGYGMGATRGIFLDATGLGGGHNALVNVLVDAGLVGALLWLSILVRLAVSLASRINRTALGPDRWLLGGLLLYLVIDSVTTESLGASANAAIILLYLSVGWVRAVLERPHPVPQQSRAVERVPALAAP